MIIKAIVLAIFVFIFYSLGCALYYLVRDKQTSTRVIKALTWRISLSGVVFVFLFVAFACGWIAPHPIV